MTRYRVEVAKRPESSFCISASEIIDIKDANAIAEALAQSAEEVRVMMIETTETEVFRFSITENT